MDSLSEIGDVVIGVDTHVTTYGAAAVVGVHSGGVLGEAAMKATPDGYPQLVEFAKQHPGLRAWAIEGARGYGSGLRRHLDNDGEPIVELHRPERQKRHHGAKSDPLAPGFALL